MIRLPDPPPDPAADARLEAALRRLATVEISPHCYACGLRAGDTPDGRVEVEDGERRHVGREVTR